MPAVHNSRQSGQEAQARSGRGQRQGVCVGGALGHVRGGLRGASIRKGPEHRLVTISDWHGGDWHSFCSMKTVVFVLVLPRPSARAPQRRSRVERGRKNGRNRSRGGRLRRFLAEIDRDGRTQRKKGVVGSELSAWLAPRVSETILLDKKNKCVRGSLGWPWQFLTGVKNTITRSFPN